MAGCCTCTGKMRPARSIAFTILGLDNAGKSTLVANLINDPTDDIQTTMGLNSQQLSKGRYRIRLLDLGGGPGIRDIWRHYYAETYGIIYVLDASDQDRMEECRQLLWETVKNEQLRGKPLLLLANKQDKPGALKPDQIIEKLQLSELITELNEMVHLLPTRVWSCSTLRSVTRGKRDPRIMRALRWILSLVGKEWQRLDDRVSQQRDLQQAEIEQARLERRRIRQERERAEEEADRAAGRLPDEDQEDGSGPRADPFKPISQVVREINAAEQAPSSESPLPPVPAARGELESADLATRTDSEVSIRSAEDEVPPIRTSTPVQAKSREGSSDANDSPHHTPSKKKPNKLLQRLKKRHKTAPMQKDGASRSPSLSLSGVPPLRAPWVSEDMELEQEFIPPPPPPSTQGGRIVKRGSPLLGMRLPKLVHQPASSTSDISQLPPVLTGFRRAKSSDPFYTTGDLALKEPIRS